MKKILLLFFICSVSLQASDNRFDSLITKGIDLIYNIKFQEAEKTFKQVIEKYPKHPAGYFFDAMIMWWKILLEPNNEDYDDPFIDKLEYVIDLCDDILERDNNNSDALFFKGGSLGFRGRLYAYRESWFNAALDGKDALPIVYKAVAAAPGNPDIQLGFGIYNYYAEVIPEKFPAVKPFLVFVPKGNRDEGLEQLNFVARNGKYAKTESLYFLATSYFTFEEDYNKAIEYTNELISKYPDNPRFQSLLGRCWVKKNNYPKASKVFAGVLKQASKNKTGFNLLAEREASYYIAAYYDQVSKLDSASIYYSMCETLSRTVDNGEETGYLINAALYLGKIYRKQGDFKKANLKFEEVLDYKDYSNSHEKAKRELELIKNTKKK